MTARRPKPCGHCHGTGQCGQVCCTTFGFKVMAAGAAAQAMTVTAPACAVCRGRGQAAR